VTEEAGGVPGDITEAPGVEEAVRYHESGSTWWPLLWGPGFCGVGFTLETVTGASHGLAWIVVGVVLLGLTALWVSARRTDRAVTLTDTTLRMGTGMISVARIARVEGVPEPVGARAIGGGFTIPAKTHPVPMELVDGSVVLGWARFSDDLVEVLAPMVEGNTAESADLDLDLPPSARPGRAEPRHDTAADDSPANTTAPNTTAESKTAESSTERPRTPVESKEGEQ